MKEEFSPDGITALFEQAARLVHGQGFSGGLTPAQWAALRYFDEAPPFNRTMASLARFHGMTLAPVTRTVRTLMDKGYVERRPNPKSRRADLIIVNEEGKKVLETDPRSCLVEIIGNVSLEDRGALVRAMRIILDGLLKHSTSVVAETIPEDLERD